MSEFSESQPNLIETGLQQGVQARAELYLQIAEDVVGIIDNVADLHQLGVF